MIGQHIAKVEIMAKLLKDMGEMISDKAMIMKITCSLPRSYNSIFAAWHNVLASEQTVFKLCTRLRKHELMVKMQGGESKEGKAFFTPSLRSSFKNFSKDDQKKRDSDFIKDLKTYTRCFNCKKKGH